MASSPFARLAAHPDVASGAAMQHLMRSGFAIIDGALGPEWAAAFRGEIQALRRGGHLHRNATLFVSKGGGNGDGVSDGAVVALEKPHVYEMSSEALAAASSASWGGCHPHRERVSTPALDALLAASSFIPSPLPSSSSLSSSSSSSSSSSLPVASGGLPSALACRPSGNKTGAVDAATSAGLEFDFGAPGLRTTVKLQANDGAGGCFPLHFDTGPGIGDGKRVTAIYYLNEDWEAGDGGELVLYPFPCVFCGRVAVGLRVLPEGAQPWKPPSMYQTASFSFFGGGLAPAGQLTAAVVVLLNSHLLSPVRHRI